MNENKQLSYSKSGIYEKGLGTIAESSPYLEKTTKKTPNTLKEIIDSEDITTYYEHFRVKFQ